MADPITATLDDNGNVVPIDSGGSQSSIDYNNAITGLFNLANTALKNTTAPKPAAAKPGTLFGYPTKTVLMTVALGVLAIWLARKIFSS